jgi:hypothetical protein
MEMRKPKPLIFEQRKLAQLNRKGKSTENLDYSSDEDLEYYDEVAEPTGRESQDRQSFVYEQQTPDNRFHQVFFLDNISSITLGPPERSA